jgi:hypothetical protein
MRKSKPSASFVNKEAYGHQHTGTLNKRTDERRISWASHRFLIDGEAVPRESPYFALK